MALLDKKNKINTMSLNYISKLDFKIRKTNIKIKKIDGFILEILGW